MEDKTLKCEESQSLSNKSPDFLLREEYTSLGDSEQRDARNEIQDASHWRMMLEMFLEEESNEKSEYVLISSTKQRLDLLGELDNDIVVVTNKPKLPLSPDAVGFSNRLSSYTIFANVVVVFGLTGSFLFYRRKRLLQKAEVMRRESKMKKVENLLIKEVVSGASVSCGMSSNQSQSGRQPLSLCSDDGLSLAAPILISESLEKHETTFLQANGSLPNLLGIQDSKAPPAILRSYRTQSSALFSQSSSSQGQTEKKMQFVSQIAQDIKLFEDVLVRHGLNPEIAPQVALSLQSSQHIVESQLEVEARRLWLDATQRQYDRHLSERQHEESLQAAKYDPNWKAKLNAKRDDCFKSINRLIIEIGLVHEIVRVVRPVFHVYKLGTLLSVRHLAYMIAAKVRKKMILS